MKKIRITALVIIMLAIGNLKANNLDRSNPSRNLSVQIQEMLKGNLLRVNGEELIGKVRFTINKQSEIVVLSVDTNSELLEDFVKHRLNYQKVELNSSVKGKIYQVPVRVLAQ
ncbi:hypothetical protein [Flagellimonas pacifica]|uniref:Uncharacterized protein n=1 Tax=Flagellimonas pacifica TaxID=1247520 RepID=A0A285MT08_9FLAO|nr:hypothetical protein [Allomuricauda parva]SNZ00268.1 hypothetical protein SAMN06265377_2088 [Allomuricauda parva]